MTTNHQPMRFRAQTLESLEGHHEAAYFALQNAQQRAADIRAQLMIAESRVVEARREFNICTRAVARQRREARELAQADNIVQFRLVQP